MSGQLLHRWNWEDPATFAAQRLEVDSQLGRCHQLDVASTARTIGRSALEGLGLTGIEFGSVHTNHPSGLSSDRIKLRTAGKHTEPGLIYRVDSDWYFIELDIAAPLPFGTGSVDWVYAEHLIEHVSLPTAISWLAETRRVLRPGGVLRLTTPDFRRYAEGYLRGGSFFADHRRRINDAAAPGFEMPERPAFMVNQLFYLFGHRWIYDADEMRYALTNAGFQDGLVSVCDFRQGLRDDVAALDQTWRNDETMYVEAVA